MYRITQEIEFCYGHRLLNYNGKCRHLHGHNGKAVIVLEGEDVDACGMLIDFTEVKKKIRNWIEEHLDHRMILCESDPVLPLLQDLGEPLFIIDRNPTAEAIARVIFLQAREQQLPVVEVHLWETSHSCATYLE